MSSAVLAPVPIHQRLKPRRARVTSGCTACRLRKKRCDERKPVCVGCERNHLICSLALDSNVQSAAATKHVSGQHRTETLAENVSRQSIVSIPGRVKSEVETPTSRSPSIYQDLAQFVADPRTKGNLSDMFGTGNLPDRASRLLFEHYITQTAGRLSIVRGKETPFITCVVPLARSDSMVMDAVLALSGAHICHTTESSDVKSMSSTHYLLAVRQLKLEMTKHAAGEATDPVRLLLTILLLSTAEAVAGDSHCTSIHHLRASSHFLTSILNVDSNHSNYEMHAFLLETHAYLVSIASVTANAPLPQTAPLLEPCMADLERYQNSQSYGMLFGYARGLLTLIPSICSFGYTRLSEERKGEFSFDSLASYKALQVQIQNWQAPPISKTGGDEEHDLIAAARIYKEAILIFLHAAFYASNVSDPDFLMLIEKSINNVAPYFYSSLAPSSPVLSIMLWPALVFGSCLLTKDFQDHLKHRIVDSSFNMALVISVVQVLDWLWEDNDPQAFGPYGLGIVMKKHDYFLSMG